MSVDVEMLTQQTTGSVVIWLLGQRPNCSHICVLLRPPVLALSVRAGSQASRSQTQLSYPFIMLAVGNCFPTGNVVWENFLWPQVRSTYELLHQDLKDKKKQIGNKIKGSVVGLDVFQRSRTTHKASQGTTKG